LHRERPLTNTEQRLAISCGGSDISSGDHQWFVDPVRAKETPFGGTIAHGLCTLALGPRFSYAMFEISGVAFGINYGYDKVGFPTPLPVGSKVRIRATLTKAKDVPDGVQFTVPQTTEYA
jgi:acyl dehydratase